MVGKVFIFIGEVVVIVIAFVVLYTDIVLIARYFGSRRSVTN